MTFLPIVERELRVAARRRATYWSRLIMAMGAIAIGASVFVANFGASQSAVGQFVFIALAVLALVYCLLSGRRSTADCLSEEKREGTLGLLFLTDLNGYDVVLGKLVATSLNAFYALLAVFPVMALPLLLGGITNGEFWRLVLSLVNTFLFSLAIGIFSSSLSVDMRRAMALNFALMFFFTAVLPACAGVLEILWHVSVPALCYSSPVYTFILGLAMNYKPRPEYYWWSLGCIHGLTWLLLFLASRIVPHSWQDKPMAAPQSPKARRQSLWHSWNYGDVRKHGVYRKQLLDANAYFWLAARARLKPLHVWTYLSCILIWWAYIHFQSGGVMDDFVDVIMALLLNTTLKLWLTLEAGQRLADDKKIGSLELILSTPLDPRDIVRGQMLALRRQFLGPMLAVIAMDIFLLFDAQAHAIHQRAGTPLIWTAGIVMLVADVVALTYVAMARALTSKTHNQAIGSTIFCVLLLPWVIFGAGVGVCNLWYVLTSLSGAPSGPIIGPGWLFALSLAADLYFGLRARRVLLEEMRLLAAQRFVSPSAPIEAVEAGPRHRTRKPVLRYALAAACLAALGWFFWPQHSTAKYAPPIVVPGNLSQGTLRIFPATMGVLFILPDGSLWRAGQNGGVFPKTATLTQIGTDTDWLEASATAMGLAGIRRDGTLWEQNQRNDASRGEMAQLDDGHDWARVAQGGMHSCAIKRDGTLWAWGNNQFAQLGNGPGPNQTNLVQVGTNDDWAAVCCAGQATFALRTNGTLWVWGAGFYYGVGTLAMNRIPMPTQVCRETNWVGFDWAGFVGGTRTIQVRNSVGELWEPFNAAPNPDLGAAATCRLTISNTVPNHVTFAYLGRWKSCEIRHDGTLWTCDYILGGRVPAASKWQQLGRRSDWLSLWGGGGTAFGLTSDGTLWTWGVYLDHAEEVFDFRARLKLLQARLMSGFSSVSPGTRLGYEVGAAMRYEKEPRPLMQSGAASPAAKAR